MKLNNDNPILSKEADEFGWSFYAEKVANTLRSVDAKNSTFVAALQGPWGSGKTSFLHLVENHLKQPGDGAPIKVAWFNPWLFQDEEDLLRSFFQLLDSEFKDKAEEKAEGVVSKIKEYSLAVAGKTSELLPVALSLLSISGNASLTAAGIAADSIAKRMLENFKAANKETDLTKLKAEIDEELSECNEKLVIFMDDLDRLSSEEIRLVFKIVTLTASFPQIVYVLAFDREVVADALGEVQHFDGNDYLQKVVQLQLELPPLSEEAVRNKLNDIYVGLDPKGLYGVNSSDRQRLYSVMIGLWLPFVSTPRQLARFANAVEVKKYQVGDEICPTDIMGLAAVQLFLPEVYDLILANSGALCSQRNPFLSLFSENIESLVKKMRELISPHARDVQPVLKAIACLFPNLAMGKGKINATAYVSVSPREEGRAYSGELLELFTGYPLDEGLTHEQLVNLLFRSNSSQFAAVLPELVAKGRLSGITSLIRSNMDEIGEQKTIDFALSLASYVGICKERNNAFLHPDYSMAAEDLLEAISNKYGSEAISNSFMARLDEYLSEQYTSVVELFYVDYITHQGAEKSSGWMNEACQMETARRIVAAVRGDLSNVLNSGESIPLDAWEIASRMLDDPSFNEFYMSLGEDRDKAICYEVCSVGQYSSTAGDGFNISDNRKGKILISLDELKAFMHSGAYKTKNYLFQQKAAALQLLLEGKRGGFGDGVKEEDADDLMNKYLSGAVEDGAPVDNSPTKEGDN